MLILDLAHILAAGADDQTDLVGINGQAVHPWRVLGQVRARVWDGLGHRVQYREARFAGKLQRLKADLERDCCQLRVHLDGVDALPRASHLEVHVTQEVLDGLHVHEGVVVVNVLVDEADGDSGHRGLDGHTGVHQRKAAGAGAGHRGGGVAAKHLRHQANRVGKLIVGGQDGLDSLGCQEAVADLASSRRAQSARLSHAEGREVVVVHEVSVFFLVQRADELLVAPSAKGRGGENLGVTAAEQAGAVNSRQEADFALQRPHLVERSVVHAPMLINHDLLQALLLDALDDIFNVGLLVPELLRQALADLFADRVLFGVPLRLVGDLDGSPDALSEVRCDGFHDGRVRLPEGEVGLGLPGDLTQLLDGVYDGLGSVKGHLHGLAHLLLRRLVALHLDLDEALTSCRNEQVEAALGELLKGRIHQELVVYAAHLYAREGPREWYAGDVHGRAGADHRHYAHRATGVNRERVDDDLNVITQTLGQQRADRPVHRPADDDSFIRGLALTLEEAARNAAH